LLPLPAAAAAAATVAAAAIVANFFAQPMLLLLLLLQPMLLLLGPMPLLPVPIFVVDACATSDVMGYCCRFWCYRCQGTCLQQLL
jgi:hypothetical protein